MRHSKISLNNRNEDLIVYSSFSQNSTNYNEIVRMKKLIKKALVTELTPRQRECLTLYYYENMKMKEIANSLSLSPSTVTRHIKAAKRRLQHIASYY